MSFDWDASTYDRIADPQARWGAAVLERLSLRGDERVIDAGCGSGRVTERLLAQLPAGRVVALDASPAMLEEARRRLAGAEGRVEFVLADLAAPLPVWPQVDAVVSTATFHWVTDHDALFRNLAAVLRPGGRLVAQCGGEGNIANLGAAVRQAGLAWTGPWEFAGAETTRRRLVAAGFTEVETWLHPEPTVFEPGEPFETFISTVCLRPLLAGTPADERTELVHRIAAALEEPRLDYVRLNIIGRRGSPDHQA